MKNMHVIACDWINWNYFFGNNYEEIYLLRKI